MSEQFFEEKDDSYSSEEEKHLEVEVEKLLTEWRAKVTDSDNARQWLNTNFGRRVLTTLKVSQLAAMKRCVVAKEEKQIRDAQFDYQVYCQVETIIASVVLEGDQALAEIESRNYN